MQMQEFEEQKNIPVVNVPIKSPPMTKKFKKKGELSNFILLLVINNSVQATKNKTSIFNLLILESKYMQLQVSEEITPWNSIIDNIICMAQPSQDLIEKQKETKVSASQKDVSKKSIVDSKQSQSQPKIKYVHSLTSALKGVNCLRTTAQSKKFGEMGSNGKAKEILDSNPNSIFLSHK